MADSTTKTESPVPTAVSNQSAAQGATPTTTGKTSPLLIVGKWIWDKGKWIWDNTDQLTKWIQAVALAIAGLWAVIIWQVRDKPALELRAGIGIYQNQGGLHVIGSPGPPDFPDTCEIQIPVWVSNTGLKPYDVEKIQIHFWQMDKRTFSGTDFPKFLDYEGMKKQSESMEAPQPQLLIGMRVMPGDERNETIDFLVKAPTKRILMFDMTLDAKGQPGLAKSRLFVPGLCRF